MEMTEYSGERLLLRPKISWIHMSSEEKNCNYSNRHLSLKEKLKIFFTLAKHFCDNMVSIKFIKSNILI